MRALRDTSAALRFGLASLVARPRNALLIVAGFLIASFVLLVVLAIPAGLQRTVGQTGSAAIAVVDAGNPLDETDATIAPDQVRLIGTLAGVAARADGSPLTAPQYAVTARLKRVDGSIASVLVRGVSPATWDVLAGLAHITRGQRPEAGLLQLAAGRVAAKLYPYANVGAHMPLVKGSFTRWQVSGIFAAGHGFWESELWADLENLRGEYNAPGQVTGIWVRLTSPQAFDDFKAALNADPRLHGLNVFRQNEFYGHRVAFLSTFVSVAAAAIAMALGILAILAGNSTVGLALRARRRELAMLRAIGFGNGALLLASLLEVVLLALLSTGLAAGAAALLLQAREINSSSGGLAVHFTMQVSWDIIAMTSVYSVVLAAGAGIVPAWRSLRTPVAAALARE